MKRFSTKLSILFLFLVGIFAIDRLFHNISDGFSTSAITSNLSFNPNWETIFYEEDKKKMQEALSQEYSYLTSGSQSFVFLSKDQNYVIKFFKHKRWRLPPLFEKIPLPNSLETKRQKWINKKKRTVQSTFNSCMIAYRDFHDQTGIIFMHLNKTDNCPKDLIISNRLGIKQKINLHKTEFILQQKAIPTSTYLKDLRKQGKTDEAKEAILSLLHLTCCRSQKGYSDKDPHLIRNFGFINHQAVELDIGGFHRDPKKNREYFHSQEIIRIRSKLLPWIQKNYPELIPFIEEQISALYSPNTASNIEGTYNFCESEFR